MNRDPLAVFLGLFFSILIFSGANNSLSAETEGAPIIYVDKTTHTFQPVFEGEELSHTFTVFNKGTTDLHIKRVTHS